jgi:hypothetical protein
MFPYRLLLDPKGGEGNGDGSSSGEAPAKPDLTSQAQNLIAKHGGDVGAVVHLMHENYREREEARSLKKLVPPPGSRVLTADEAKAWDAYLKFGQPADIEAAFNERNQYKAESDGFRKAELIREAATFAGYKPSVLATVVKADGLDLEIERDDKGVPKKVTVRDGDKTVPLGEFAEARWQDHLPALKADSARPPGTPSRETQRRIPEGDGQKRPDRLEEAVASGVGSFMRF